uniref:Uncharacterized protein n=1 Tax=Arundo donax TaxID=35708 RepID=A0A0A9F2X6_ARUDO
MPKRANITSLCFVFIVFVFFVHTKLENILVLYMNKCSNSLRQSCIHCSVYTISVFITKEIVKAIARIRQIERTRKK